MFHFRLLRLPKLKSLYVSLSEESNVAENVASSIVIASRMDPTIDVRKECKYLKQKKDVVLFARY